MSDIIRRRVLVTVDENEVTRHIVPAGRIFVFCPPVFYSYFRGMLMVKLADLPTALLSQFTPRVVLDGAVPYAELVDWFRTEEQHYHESEKKEEQAIEKLSAIIESKKRKSRRQKVPASAKNKSSAAYKKKPRR